VSKLGVCGRACIPGVCSIEPEKSDMESGGSSRNWSDGAVSRNVGLRDPGPRQQARLEEKYAARARASPLRPLPAVIRVCDLRCGLWIRGPVAAAISADLQLHIERSGRVGAGGYARRCVVFSFLRRRLSRRLWGRGSGGGPGALPGTDADRLGGILGIVIVRTPGVPGLLHGERPTGRKSFLRGFVLGFAIRTIFASRVPEWAVRD